MTNGGEVGSGDWVDAGNVRVLTPVVGGADVATTDAGLDGTGAVVMAASAGSTLLERLANSSAAPATPKSRELLVAGRS